MALDESFKHFNANYIQLFDLSVIYTLLGIKKYLFLDYKYNLYDEKSLAISILDLKKIKYKLLKSIIIKNDSHYIIHYIEISKKYNDAFIMCMIDLVYYMYFNNNYKYFLLANRNNLRLWLDGQFKNDPDTSTNLYRINSSLVASQITTDLNTLF